MLPTNKLHDHFAAGFRSADYGHRLGLSFPLDASWPIMPLCGPYSSSGPEGDSLGEGVRRILQDLKLHGLVGSFRAWGERLHYRRELRRLLVAAPHMIDDIGLTLEQALVEADRPFWRR